jgi:hypothetical protein
MRRFLSLLPLKHICHYLHASTYLDLQYVTAVGATQGVESGLAEVSCQSQLGGVITSGGGFSRYYAQPSFQTSDVISYFSTVNGSGNSPQMGYGSGRGYPDISAAGVNFEVAVGGSIYTLSGTSCSSPVVAGRLLLLFSLLLFEVPYPDDGMATPPSSSSSSASSPSFLFSLPSSFYLLFHSPPCMSYG